MDNSTDPSPLPLSRRNVLRGAVAVTVVGAAGGLGLVGCSDDGDEGADTDTDSTDTDGAGSQNVDGSTDSAVSLVLMTDARSTFAAGEPVRLPLGLGDSNGALLLDTPDVLTLDLTDEDGAPIENGTGLEVPRRDNGLERAYYPLVFTPAAAGFYTVSGTLEGEPISAAFEVREIDDIVLPRPGQPLPATATPTVAEAGGVDPICTAETQCSLHEVDLAEVLGSSPVAVLVSTPAFCATAICGPVLDLFEQAAESHTDVTFIHVEPYASGDLVRENGPSADNLSPAVAAWQLPFEPCLFLVDAEGNVAERIDVIYDADELDEALTRLTA